jgi:uncharacterized protein (TIGR02391 family)
MMGVSRPLPKAVLKKMFLKTLHDHLRPGGKHGGGARGYDGILMYTLAYDFQLGKLQPDEFVEARRGVFELERDGYIMQDVSQPSEVFKVLTAKGLAVLERDLGEMELPSIDIEELLSRDDLRAKVRDDYLAADFESAVFKAFKLVEETVRRKAGQPAAAVGVNLMTAAFKQDGALKHPEAQVDSEREGLHQLFRGAIGWFKNPSLFTLN